MAQTQILNYQSPPPRISKLAVGAFVASVLIMPGFFLVFPSLFMWVIAMGVSTELDTRPRVTGQQLARAAIHVSGWSALLGVLAIILGSSFVW